MHQLSHDELSVVFEFLGHDEKTIVSLAKTSCRFLAKCSRFVGIETRFCTTHYLLLDNNEEMNKILGEPSFSTHKNEPIKHVHIDVFLSMFLRKNGSVNYKASVYAGYYIHNGVCQQHSIQDCSVERSDIVCPSLITLRLKKIVELVGMDVITRLVAHSGLKHKVSGNVLTQMLHGKPFFMKIIPEDSDETKSE
jgi:hypothetical protein